MLFFLAVSFFSYASLTHSPQLFIGFNVTLWNLRASQLINYWGLHSSFWWKQRWRCPLWLGGKQSANHLRENKIKEGGYDREKVLDAYSRKKKCMKERWWSGREKNQMKEPWQRKWVIARNSQQFTAYTAWEQRHVEEREKYKCRTYCPAQFTPSIAQNLTT